MTHAYCLLWRDIAWLRLDIAPRRMVRAEVAEIEDRLTAHGALDVSRSRSVSRHHDAPQLGQCTS
jgi:hypothetical protein